MATDEISNRHFQKVKLTFGADGTATDTADSAGARFPTETVHESVITCTVASGNTVSGAVDLAGIRNMGLIVPSTFDGTAITFQVSDTLGGTYVGLYDITNAQVSMTITTSRAYDLPGELMAWRFVKIVCGTAQAATDTIFLLVTRS